MVRKDLRRHGIGERLIRSFEQWSVSRGSKLVGLFTRRAAPFYEAIGHESSGTFFRRLLSGIRGGRRPKGQLRILVANRGTGGGKSMSQLRVLITNITLGGRTGTETYVRDLATGLLRCGHRAIVYCPNQGEIAQELREATVPVWENMAENAVPPDVIHGHHHLETMTGLLRFPAVPALFVCHDPSAWHDAPPRHPRIRRYLAVDEACRDRLVLAHGIPESLVHLVPNAVDLERFRPRSPLPVRPRRALLFCNYSDTHHADAVRRVCARAGIECDAVGANSGGLTSEPETILGNYDLVFAKGRCALEALAVGAAVVVCGPSGVGPLVTVRELPQLRRLSFGPRVRREPFNPEDLAAEIARYDAADAAEVSRQVRAAAVLDILLEELIDLYEEVIAEQRAAPPPVLEEELGAAATYVGEWSTQWRGILQREYHRGRCEYRRELSEYRREYHHERRRKRQERSVLRRLFSRDHRR